MRLPPASRLLIALAALLAMFMLTRTIAELEYGCRAVQTDSVQTGGFEW